MSGPPVETRLILYVAGPMTGLPKFNYPAFEQARADLEAAGYEVLCPTDNGGQFAVGSLPWPWYMRKALTQLVKAEGMAVLPGAACSRGSLVEINVARALEMEVLPVDEWISRLIEPS